MQDSGSLAVFKVTARDQGHYKGPSGAFVTYCNISCFYYYYMYFFIADLSIYIYCDTLLPSIMRRISKDKSKQ